MMLIEYFKMFNNITQNEERVKGLAAGLHISLCFNVILKPVKI